MSTFADEVVRDPFTRPVEFKLREEMAKALKTLLGDKAREKVLILYRASQPINVIGTKPGPPCACCGEATHMAPSSAKVLEEGEAVTVCMTCIERVLMKLEAER